jgi:hypothetical protein
MYRFDIVSGKYVPYRRFQQLSMFLFIHFIAPFGRIYGGIVTSSALAAHLDQRWCRVIVKRSQSMTPPQERGHADSVGNERKLPC